MFKCLLPPGRVSCTLQVRSSFSSLSQLRGCSKRLGRGSSSLRSQRCLGPAARALHRLGSKAQAISSNQELASTSSQPAALSVDALPVVYMRKALQPGEIVEKLDSSVVVVGNIPKGCKVVAGGDVVVMGQLLGEAQAGAAGSSESMVVAMTMNPTKLTINETSSVAAPNASGPLMASLSNGLIVFKPAYDGAAAPAVEGGKGGALSQAGGALLSLAGLLLLLAPLTSLGSAVKALDETLLGSVLDSIVYGFILLRGANLLSDGSELLLEILDPGVIGGVVLPLLGALPDSLIILVSGLSGTREQAQEEVAVGIGTLAGSTILLLSLTWGASLLLGRCDLDEQGNAVNRKLTKGWDLTATGVTTDDAVPNGARIMMATVLLYGIIQVPAFFGDVSDPGLALTGGVVCLLSALAYCAYQVAVPELQKRRIDAARKKRFRMYTVKALAKKSEPFGSLVDSQGTVKRGVVDKIFDTFDHDRNGSIDRAELQALLLGLELTALREVVEEESMAYWLKEFDTDLDKQIDKDEFYTTLTRWVGEKTQEVKKQYGVSVAPTSGLLAMELPDDDVLALQALGKQIDPEEEREDEEDEKEIGPISTRDIALQAAARMFGGIALCALFSDPLVESLSNFSKASGVAPFYVGFILTPLASNASEVVSSLKFAAKKRQKNISLTFSQVYGAVTMNNTFVLGLFLLVMYLRKLDWVYSSEVTAIVGSTLALGAVASQKKTFEAWWAIPAVALYPASLLTVQFLDSYFGWQ